MNFKERYKEEIEAISFSPDFEERLYKRIKNEDIKNKITSISKKKIITLFAAVITIIALLSAGTVAEPSKHTPDATTVQYQRSNSLWEDRWKKGRQFPHSKGNSETYDFTVLGITSGDFLNNCEGFSADEGREYFVTAVRAHEYVKLTLKNGEFHIKITPLIYGREPWETNSSTVCEDVRIIEKNGVIYYLFDTSFLDRFEGRTLCFACYDGEKPTSDIFNMDENGIITLNEKYSTIDASKKFGAIIELPRDMTDTHPEIAEEWLLNDTLSKLY